MKKITLLIVLIMSLMACESKKDTKLSFESLLKNYQQQKLEFNPLEATYTGISGYNDRFPNTISESYRASLRDFYSDFLVQLKGIDKEALSEIDQMSYDVLKWECEINLEGLKYSTHLTPIDQMWSPHLLMGQLASGTSAQPFETVEDYKNWLKRVDQFIIWSDTAIKNMREGITQNRVLPASLILKVIPQMESQLNPDLDTHLYFQPAMSFPDEFTEEERAELTANYQVMVTEKIIPAFSRMTQFLKDEYLPNGRSSSGIDVYADGKEYYQYQIKFFTTTNMTADQIFELGKSEVARIQSEMEKVKTSVGFKGDFKAFFDHVRAKKELMPFTDPSQVIANFNSIHETMKPSLNKLFDVVPKAGFEVKQTEAFRAASASAEYSQGSKDGSRPGVFYVPIPNVNEYNNYSDESLFLHEAIPGHHYQVSLQQENETLPEFRQTLWYSAYGEGWALYSESLGKELGLYTDPYQYFGMLGAEMHRAIRLVVDAGMHTQGWTREQAIQYSLENEAVSEAGIIAEIERYMALPGQALSYKIGQLKIMELRKKASENLGEKFDIREFHKIVLSTGCIPLELLEGKIDQWILDKKGSSISGK